LPGRRRFETPRRWRVVVAVRRRHELVVRPVPAADCPYMTCGRSRPSPATVLRRVRMVPCLGLVRLRQDRGEYVAFATGAGRVLVLVTRFAQSTISPTATVPASCGQQQ
jgi:hypothetical protein